MPSRTHTNFSAWGPLPAQHSTGEASVEEREWTKADALNGLNEGLLSSISAGVRTVTSVHSRRLPEPVNIPNCAPLLIGASPEIIIVAARCRLMRAQGFRAALSSPHGGAAAALTLWQQSSRSYEIRRGVVRPAWIQWAPLVNPSDDAGGVRA